MAKLSENQQGAMKALNKALEGGFAYADAAAWKKAAAGEAKINAASLVKADAVEELTIAVSSRTVKVYRPKA